MRIAHLSDLHVTEGARLDDQAAALDRLALEVAEARPDLIAITGDLAGRTVPHRSTPRERAVLYPWLVDLAEVAPVEVLYGNHDQSPDVDTLPSLGGTWPIRVRARAGVDTVRTRSGRLHVYWLAYPTKRWILQGEDVPPGVEAAQQLVNAKLAALLRLWGVTAARRVAAGEHQLFLGHVQVGGSRTSGGEVLAGQEIEISARELEDLTVDYQALGHLHLQQQVASRAWYAGSPWPTDHAEVEAGKGWLLVELRPGQSPLVERRALKSWRMLTLDYRWAELDDGRPGWTHQPTAEQLAAVDARTEVRMRLVVPQQWVESCPWADHVARISERALRVAAERTIEPVLRMRAPAVATARTTRDKLAAYWTTLGTAPSDSEQAAALGCLADLETLDDDDVLVEVTP